MVPFFFFFFHPLERPERCSGSALSRPREKSHHLLGRRRIVSSSRGIASFAWYRTETLRFFRPRASSFVPPRGSVLLCLREKPAFCHVSKCFPSSLRVVLSSVLCLRLFSSRHVSSGNFVIHTSPPSTHLSPPPPLCSSASCFAPFLASLCFIVISSPFIHPLGSPLQLACSLHSFRFPLLPLHIFSAGIRAALLYLSLSPHLSVSASAPGF